MRLPMTPGRKRAATGRVRPLWARQDLNLRPLACEASALPLSYAPEDGTLSLWSWRTRGGHRRRRRVPASRRRPIAEPCSSDGVSLAPAKSERKTHIPARGPSAAGPPGRDGVPDSRPGPSCSTPLAPPPWRAWKAVRTREPHLGGTPRPDADGYWSCGLERGGRRSHGAPSPGEVGFRAQEATTQGEGS